METFQISPAILSESPRGASCVFVKIDSGRGLKLYTSRREAVECRWRQRKAARVGLAPRVFGKTELTIGGRHYYGYITEVAEVVPFVNGRLELPWPAQVIIEESTEFDDLFNSLREIGMGGDLVVRNIGWIRGKMVCIDFSHHSVW